MSDTLPIEAVQQLVIRKPAAEVFRAFADPEVTTEFWFNRASGPLEPGAEVTWYFDVFNVSAAVRVVEFEPPERIVYEWGSADFSDATRVEMTFEQRPEERTYVRIANSGFGGGTEKAIATALDAVGGFSLVLAAAKAWLEYGVHLRVVEDKC